MINNLEQLLSSVATPVLKLVPRTVEWPVKDPQAGVVRKEELKLFVVDDLTFAASERIYLGDKGFGRNARVISERLRFGDNEKSAQQMSYAQAADLPDEYGWILLTVVAQYDKEQEDLRKAEEEKLKAEGKDPKA